jgi:gamma-glutamylcysteine synthetase
MTEIMMIDKKVLDNIRQEINLRKKKSNRDSLIAEGMEYVIRKIEMEGNLRR